MRALHQDAAEMGTVPYEGRLWGLSPALCPCDMGTILPAAGNLGCSAEGSFCHGCHALFQYPSDEACPNAAGYKAADPDLRLCADCHP